MEKHYIKNLTPIRGVAALLVVFYHANLILHGALAGTFVAPIFSRLYLMVDLFFMISGFVMSHAYGSWFDKDVSVKKFLQFSIARFARIYPLYLFTLFFLVSVVVIYHYKIGETPQVFKETFNFNSIPVNIFLLQNINTSSLLAWNPPSWSISVEWWVYIIFPFMVFFYNRIKFKYLNLLLLIFSGMGYLILSVIIYNLNRDIVAGIWPKNYGSIDVTDPSNYQSGLLRCIFGFLIGMVAYQYFKLNSLKRFLSKDYAMLAFTVLLLCSLKFSVPDYITIWGFPCIILCAAYSNNNKILNATFLKKMGDWSYSLYLIHMPIFYTFILFVLLVPENKYILPYNGEPLLAWIVGYTFISLNIFIAYLTYNYIELPARQVIKKMANI